MRAASFQAHWACTFVRTKRGVFSAHKRASELGGMEERVLAIDGMLRERRPFWRDVVDFVCFLERL